MFYEEDSLGRERAGNRNRRQGDISPSTHSEVIKGCVYSVTILISKEEITVLSSKKRVKKQKPLSSSHCLISQWAGACWGSRVQEQISGKGRIQTSQELLPAAQQPREHPGREEKSDISAGHSPSLQTRSLMRNTDRRGKEMSKQHNLEEQSLP